MLSPSTSNTSVASGGSESTNSAAVVEYRFPYNGLRTDPVPGLEPLYFYQSGGHHPVHLEDCLGDENQYRVIGKLGSGGFGNVWLCRNVKRTPPQYVALKILMAEMSSDESNSRESKNIRRLQELAKTDVDINKYCLLPLDEFVIEGPNGTHQCFAYPVAGPTVGDISIHVPSPTNTLRRIIRQAVEAMAALHRQGVCHGDFRPGNILLRLDGLNGLREKKAREYFGRSYICEVKVMEGYPDPGESAPEYVVCPVKPEDNHLVNAANLCVIDYGEAFDPSSPPEKGVGIPLPYCAPEILLGGKCGFASDIWALATTIFEIRMGNKLFSLSMDEVDDYLHLLVEMLGPMPEPWWSTTWESRRESWLDEADANGQAVPVEPAPFEPSTISTELDREIMHFFLGPRGEDIELQVPEEEKPIFEDLLKMMLRWNPEDRPSAEEVLKHPWFSLEDEDDEVSRTMEVDDDQSEDEETENESESDEMEYETEGDEEEDEEMPDAETEGVDEESREPKPGQQLEELLKDNDKDDQKNGDNHSPKDTQKDTQKHDQEDDMKDDQGDDQKGGEGRLGYQKVEEMEYRKGDQDEPPKVDSQDERAKEKLLVSKKSGLLKIAVDTRFRGVAAWVKKVLKWSRR
ncbi:kinase-like domain-containing protein [Aspergillus carlsbadensis]|nr:kinase-like domain-containing protein [Aspergillus carlsbadensis]